MSAEIGAQARPSILTIQAIFFVQALAGGGIFARIPDVQTALGLSEGLLGTALAVGAAGGLAANLVSGRIVGAVGTRPLLRWGLPALAALNAAIAVAPSVVVVFLFLVLSGAAFSLTNVAMNVEADRIEQASGQRVMNRCHGLWSFGMLFAAGLGAVARGLPVAPGPHLWAMVPVVAVASALLLRRMVPADEPAAASGPGRFALPSLRTALVVLFGASAVIAQMGAQNWSVIYMRDNFSTADWVDTLVLTSFLLTMALGRVLADGWITFFGAPRVAAFLSALGAVSVLLIATTHSVPLAILGFAALGFGSAVQFPLMITAAARIGRRPAAQSVSAAIFLVGLIMLVAPGAMGWIAELWGLRAGFACLAFPFVASVLLVRRVVR